MPAPRSAEHRAPTRRAYPPACMLALAFPDRIAQQPRATAAFVLANGRGAAIEQASALARAPFVAVAELTGSAAQGRILLGGADHASLRSKPASPTDRDASTR